MFTYSHSHDTAAAPAAVWRLYSDVATWPVWDSSVEAVTLDGPFAAGTCGTLHVTGQPPLPLRLVEVTPNGSFTDATDLPGAGIVITFTHTLSPLPAGGTRITHAMSITGPAAATLGPELGPAIVEDMPEAMASLAAHAEAAESRL